MTEVLTLLMPKAFPIWKRELTRFKFKNFTEKNYGNIVHWTRVEIDNPEIFNLLDEKGEIIPPSHCTSRAEYLEFLLTPMVEKRSVSLSKSVKDWVFTTCTDLVAASVLMQPDELSRRSLEEVVVGRQLHQDLTKEIRTGPTTVGSNIYQPSLWFKNPNDAMLFKLTF